jgi:hypothetical protein
MAQACPGAKATACSRQVSASQYQQCHALAADDQAVAEGVDGLEEGCRCGGEVAGAALLSVAVEDAEEQGPGVEIDAGVGSGLGRGLEATQEGLRIGVVRREAAGCQLHLRRREPS